MRVFLVNARHTKNLPCRKTDVNTLCCSTTASAGRKRSACCGPTGGNAQHVASASACIQRMQEVLTEMNVQLANAITDISGMTGMAILQAILKGSGRATTRS